MSRPLTVVCGPSGSGKSTYIHAHATPGDVIVDFDELCVALSGLPLYHKPPALVPLVSYVRTVLLRLLQQKSYGGHTWIALGLPTRQDRWVWQQHGASVVLLDVPAEECLRRIAQDTRRQGVATNWQAVIEAWWTVYRGEN